MHLDLTELIKAIGYLGVFAVVFAESGLFFGFFLPGDSLLFTAGVLASQGYFNIAIMVVLIVSGAILGDSVGYFFGRKMGARLFEKQESRLFKKSHLEKANAFYEKHGGKTIILARFMPLIRTFAPIVAGAAKMNYRNFLMFNVVGGLVWGVGVTLSGYYLGQVIPDVDKYLIPIIALVVFLSILPPVLHVLKEKESRNQLKTTLFNFVYSLPFLGPKRK